jgi:hypothetical protein
MSARARAVNPSRSSERREIGCGSRAGARW